MAYFVKSTRSIGLTQSVLHFNFKSGFGKNPFSQWKSACKRILKVIHYAKGGEMIMAFEMDLQTIENPHTRRYMREVISDYNNDNYRSAVILLYVVVMSDLVEKLGSLSRAYGNEAAKAILEKLKNGYQPYDASREKFLVEETQKRLPSMLLPEAIATVKSIKEWRNVSAHPSLADDSPEPLGRPSQETVAGLIRDTIRYILSQSADLSTKSFSLFLEEIASVEDIFPEDALLNDYLNKRYFTKFNETTYNYFVEHLFRIVFGVNSPEAEKHRAINFAVLTMLIDNKRDLSFPFLSTPEKFQDTKISNEHITTLLMSFFRLYPEAFANAPDFVSKLIKSKTDDDYSLMLDNYFLDSRNLAEHITNLLADIEKQGIQYDFFNGVDWTSERVENLKRVLKRTGDTDLFNELAILSYSYSNSYNTADARFELLIDPNLEFFTKDQFTLFFGQANSNNQCYDRFRAASDHKKAFTAYQSRFETGLSLDDFKDKWPSFASRL